MVICFAAGNDGEEPVRRALDKGHIGAEAAAKNCITIGASRISRDPMGPNPDAVADFSSRGPVKNRRQAHTSFQQIQAWCKRPQIPAQTIIGVTKKGQAWPRRSSQAVQPFCAKPSPAAIPHVHHHSQAPR
ncbi:hypothetical protein MMC31_000851 [Peltigera leucophlebia]|nr:hypothetical protein [Peltigera leucophlebia]